MFKLRSVASVCLVLASASGCGVKTPAPYYDYAARGASRVHVSLRSDGAPLTGALVQLSALVDDADEYGQPELQGPELLWQGRSDARGEIDVTVYPLLSRRYLRVVVHAPGYEGPYSNLSERARLAEWAPAAAVQAPLEASHDLFLEMQALLSEGAATTLATAVRGLWAEHWASPSTQWPPQQDAGFLIQQDTELTVRGLGAPSPYETAVGYFVTDAGAPDRVIARGLLQRGAERLGAGDSLRDELGQPRRFRKGERVDFFIVPNGWRLSGVRGWSPQDPQLPYLEPVGNMVVNVASSVPSLNPEAAHGCLARSRRAVTATVRTEDEVVHHVIGFEELTRTRAADDDFNDVIFEVQAPSASALHSAGARSFDVEQPDPDSDGVAGMQDAFPLDSERSYVLRVPDRGFGVLALEDGELRAGEADYNDAVVHYRYDLVLNATGRVRSLVGTFFSVTQGERAPLALGLALHDLPEEVGGTVGLQRFTPEGGSVVGPLQTLQSLRAESGAVVLQDVLPVLPAQPLPAGGDSQSMVWQAPLQSARFKITFDSAISRSLLSPEAMEPYFSGAAGVLLRSSLPAGAAGGAAQPRILDLPNSWAHPRQGVSMAEAYPDFELWLMRDGLDYQGWYLRPSGVAMRVMRGPDLDDNPPTWLQGVGQ